MRKAYFSALMIAPLLLLSACSGEGPYDQARDIQQEFSAARQVDMNVSLRADYGERVYDYVLECSIGESEGSVTIKEPETVSGVTAKLDSDGITLCYDGAEIYTGVILPDGLTPVDSIPVMVRAWSGGLITEAVKEKYGSTDCIAAIFRISDTVSLRTWFEAGTHLPLHAEFSSDGFTVILCDFENMILF